MTVKRSWIGGRCRGFSRKRADEDGLLRYTAYYRDAKDRECSAGTFPNKKDADKAWQRAEAKIAEGRLGDPGRGRQTFQAYVEQVWLPGHQIEATTRQSYTYSIYRHLMPEFGRMRMIDILPEHVRAWVAKLKDAGRHAGDDPVQQGSAERDLHDCAE